MLEDILEGLRLMKGRLVSAVGYLFLGSVLIAGLALINEATAPVEPAVADLHRSDYGSKEVTRQPILEWMKENSTMPEQVLSKIYSMAMNSGKADLILAICLVESNFNPHVESDKGAIGLMGIMPGVWLDELKAHGIVKGQEDLYIISGNMRSGIYVLESYLARTNNLTEALSRYSGGDPSYAARVRRALGEISRARHSEAQLYLARAQN